MAYSIFQENKIIKVAPGKLSRYIKDTNLVSNTGRTSVTYYQNELAIPARFKMYLHQIKISRCCHAYIRRFFQGDIFITIKWSMFEFEEFITSPEKLDHNKTKFDFTIKYALELDEDFVYRISETPITFKLHAVCDGTEIFLSQTQFFVDNILEVVNHKQSQRLFFTSIDVDPNGENIAYLDVWYKFTCKQKTLRSLFPTTKVNTKKKSMTKIADLLSDKFSKKSQNFGTVHVTDSEFDHFADSVLLVLNRNKVLKTTQSDINTELQERVRWLRFEANWKQTLQENAILHGKNPEDVIWRQWREEDTANVRLRTYDDYTQKTYEPELTITIVDLYFLEGCSVLKNDQIRQFFVEYSFLGQEGPEMETPFSVAKKQAEERIVFNFSKTFPINKDYNPKNCKLLTDLIKKDDIIKFTVVSEPLETADKPIQTCTEIGYAEVPFSELIQVEENTDSYEYEIIDRILAMRKMALDFMAPKDYKLYV
ncbi:uncharacterized protein LOC123014690 [Tribolium madens]|uniref:uncharacterized protein LOC123014690 n=1 Tax=Tribolium madens TaxID=41895 RepID=UPI001CF75FB4|nr:uncharacterized protein LOC123014690 [Tribolium madens]